MACVKRIVCLANSYKPPNGRCVAGREVVGNGFGEWIRPVSPRPTAEVSFSEYRYENNSSPRLLDIIDIPLLNPDPRHHSTENYVIDEGRWAKVGVLPFNVLEQLRDLPTMLWINKDHTKGDGCFDCVSDAEAFALRGSLVLIKPDNFGLEVGRHYWTGKKTCRAAFDYNGTHYNLSLTDPIARDAFVGRAEGRYPLTDMYLCVSLTEPYEHDDRCHKLVAAIINGSASVSESMQDTIFTIGHSTHPQERFIALLRQHGITALCDVRSKPYSRMNPQFNREDLEEKLQEHGIAYRFLGKELGARSEDPDCYEGGRVQYCRLAETDLFKHGIKRVLRGMKEDFRIALMCAEKDPLECHRTILVARRLVAFGVAVAHIHADGRLESHDNALSRLARIVNLAEHDMFHSREEMLADAYRRQEERIAYEVAEPADSRTRKSAPR